MTIRRIMYTIAMLGLMTSCKQIKHHNVDGEMTETVDRSQLTISKDDSTEIVNKIEDWNKGWKTKDYELATKWYSDKAEFTNAFGHHRIGHKEIAKLIEEVFQLPFVMMGDSKVTDQKFMVLDGHGVLVITSIERTGQKSPDNKELGVRKTTHHRLFVKENEWLIVGHLISDARSTESNRH